MQSKRTIGRWLAALALALAASAAAAQDWPTKPIRFIVPYPPGGGTDIIARIVQDKLSSALGQTIVIDNRGGAAGNIGTELAAKAAPDGYTFLFTLSSHTINPIVYGKLNFDVEKDFAPVSLVASLPQIITAHPSTPFSDLAGMVAYAKANPGKINFASAGIGSGSHLASEYFKTVAGIEIVHVPYKGTGNALQDLLAGNVQMTIDSMAALLPSIKAGSLRALAVTTLERSPNLPDVPTLAELLAGFDASPMNYLSVRGGTPKPIIDRINREVNAVLAMPAIRERAIGIGVAVSPSTPDEMIEQVRSEQRKWKKVIEISGAKAE